MPASQTRENYPISSKKIIKKTLANFIWGVLIGIVPYIYILFVLAAHSSDLNAPIAISPFISNLLVLAPLIGLGFLVIIGVFNYLYQYWYFKDYFYDLTPDYVIIKKGVLTPREITIPYERIQDVYMDQDIFDRIFGLYDVHLSSATSASGMQAHIDGLEQPAAEGLRDLLLSQVSTKMGKAPMPMMPASPAITSVPPPATQAITQVGNPPSSNE